MRSSMAFGRFINSKTPRIKLKPFRSYVGTTSRMSSHCQCSKSGHGTSTHQQSHAVSGETNYLLDPIQYLSFHIYRRMVAPSATGIHRRRERLGKDSDYHWR